MVLAQIMDSKSKIKVLEKLIDKNGSFSVSELSRLSDLPKATISGIIKDWESAGLVLCEQQGRNKLVSISQKFYLLPEIKKMFSKTGVFQVGLVNKLKSASSLGAKHVKAVVVFGSRIRTDFTSKSDLDVLVVIPENGSRHAEAVAEELVKLSKETGVKYSPVFLSEKELLSRIKENDTFIKNVLTEGNIIKGGKWLGDIQTAPGFGKRKV